MTNFELMQALTSIHSSVEAAELCAKHNNKDMFMLWGKEVGHSAKFLHATWKAVQPEKTTEKRVSIASLYNDWLVASARTEQESYEYIVKAGLEMSSANVLLNVNHYLNLWSLADRVRGNSGTVTIKGINKKLALAMIAENDAEPVLSEAEQAAFDFLEAETAKPISKWRRSLVAADKVAHLNNDELTRLYTEAAQKLNAYYSEKKRAKKSA